MVLRLYNTATREQEPFRPAGNRVRMYVCGPTVYDYSHLGHAKAYVFADVLRRYLEFQGHDVNQVLNFTDIEDSITKRAQEEGGDPLGLAERYIAAFHEDMGRLKIRRAHAYPRVTDHVAEIIAAVRELVERDRAYVVDGEVYMRVAEEDVGALTGRAVEEMLVEEGPSEGARESPLDFALWKRPKKGEPAWDSPWGRGRPGWHVECYAMAKQHAGLPLDIHTGGQDLIYPHHESEALVGRALGHPTFSRFWLHNGFMTLEGGRMAKSLGNFVTIRDALKEVNWEALRLFLLKSHYRANTDYSDTGIQAAAQEQQEIARAIRRLDAASEGGAGREEAVDRPLLEAAEETRDTFFRAMDDDLRTDRAVAAVLQLARRVNDADVLPAVTAETLYADVCDYCTVLGLCEEEFAEG